MRLNAWVRTLDFLNRRGKGWACRLVQLTGKHPDRIHPKHLLPNHDRGWFLDRLKPTDRLLDLGCGHGLHGLAATWTINYVGGIVFCDREVPNHPAVTWRFVQADLEDPLPFRDRSFDAVLMLDVLEHLNNRDQALHEVYRILKPGGLLFLAVPNAGSSWRQRLRAAGLFAFSDPDHVCEYVYDDRDESGNSILGQGRQKRPSDGSGVGPMLDLDGLTITGWLRATQQQQGSPAITSSPGSMGTGLRSDPNRAVGSPSLRQPALRSTGTPIPGDPDREHGGLPEQGTPQIRGDAMVQDALSAGSSILGGQSQARGDQAAMPRLPQRAKSSLGTEGAPTNLREEICRNGFEILSIAPVPALDTPWAGLIDLVGGLHLPTYRRLVEWKRRRALEDPVESTGFLVVART